MRGPTFEQLQRRYDEMLPPEYYTDGYEYEDDDDFEDYGCDPGYDGILGEG